MNTDRPVFLITGASSGIGAATARQAVAAGFRVVLAARSRSKLEQLVKELGGETHALAIEVDVTDWASQQQMLTNVLETWGRLDVVYANAGISKGSLFVGGDDTPDEWRDMILTNIYGVAVLARLCIPELIKQQGHLLVTGSVAGRVTNAVNLYSATKWAITGMGHALRQQLVGTGVRLTVIEPGMVDTPFWKLPPTVSTLHADDVARAVLYAVQQPAHVDVNEIVVRPVGQTI